MLFPNVLASKTPPRVVVTGAGIITGLGVGWKANAAGFREGRSSAKPVSLFDVSRQRVKVAAEVLIPAMPTIKLTARQISRFDRAGRLLLLAAHEAWHQAGWKPSEELPLILGTTSGGMTSGEAFYKRSIDNPNDRRELPTLAVTYHAHSQAGILADAFGFSGPILNLSNACATGSSAIGHAWEWIRMGRAQRVFAGGYDALGQLVFAGFDSLQVLSPTTCRPFDAHRDGLLLGEGAAMLSLETEESARRRGAEILGEIAGYGSSFDAYHLTQPSPEGDAVLLSMNRACRSAGIIPEQVNYVNAHGTGTLLNDSSEAAAINRWAGAHAADLQVSSTKASVGHLLGGAGAVEAVVALMTLREQWLPPESSIGDVDPICHFPIVRNPMEARVDTVLSNSFGFGGGNATLIFRRWS